MATHGMRKTRIYSIWRGMKYRCQNPNHYDYKRYGARGIKVCDRWQKFENFYADMGEGYKDSLTIDRIDNKGNYEPSNCRWVNRKIQANNRRTCHLLTFNGETKNIREWAYKLGISENTIHSRLRHKLQMEEILKGKYK